MARDRTLVRAGQFAQIARQGGLILIALALPRLGMSAEEIGHWEGLLFLGYLLGFGWLTGLTQAYLVTVRRRPDGAAYGRLVLLRVTLTALVLLGSVVLTHDWLFRLLRFSAPPPGWWFFLGFLLVQWPALLFEQMLAVAGRPRTLALFGGAGALGMLAALLIPLWRGGGLEVALYWLLVFSVIRALVILALTLLLFPLRERSVSRPPRLWATAWPLMAFASVAALTTAFDPWFVNYWYDGDPTTFALFRYGAREVPLLAALTNGMTIVVLPRLTESTAAGLDLLRDSSRRLYHWVFPGIALLLLTSSWWWPLVFTNTFLPSLPLFQVYVFVVISRLLFPVTVLTALGHTRMLPVFALLEFFINVLLSWLLVRWFGLTGIVWATVLAYLIDKGCLVAYLRYRTGIGPGRYTDLRWYGGYVLLLLLVYLGQ